ncbi:MAG: 4Fe-4S binding protein, partial [Eubacteriales bacterium]|nr:4Fe-4S binding protein [Eubacteriales bacterium]
DEKGRVLADEVTYQTAQPDIFVGGDAHTGPKFAIDAIAQGKQAAISIHRYVHPGQSLVIGRDRLTYRAFDKDNVDFDTVRRDYDATARQVPGKDAAKASSFKDDRKTFTEEQVKKETARCLGCGASFVDPNKCLGCGVCTTKCRFDAIHLKKRTFVESIDYFDRPKVLPEFVEGRRKRIEIRKMSEKK